MQFQEAAQLLEADGPVAAISDRVERLANRRAFGILARKDIVG